MDGGYRLTMPTYEATVHSRREADEVFTYLADFRSVAEWDPSITSSEHVNDGEPIQVGALYRVTTSMAGHETPMDYETVELERPRKIVLHGENDAAVSDDTITIVPRAGGGCDVTYLAELELKGARKVATPLMSAALQRLGSKAKSGLEEKLNP